MEFVVEAVVEVVAVVAVELVVAQIVVEHVVEFGVIGCNFACLLLTWMMCLVVVGSCAETYCCPSCSSPDPFDSALAPDSVAAAAVAAVAAAAPVVLAK